MARCRSNSPDTSEAPSTTLETPENIVPTAVMVLSNMTILLLLILHFLAHMRIIIHARRLGNPIIVGAPGEPQATEIVADLDGRAGFGAR